MERKIPIVAALIACALAAPAARAQQQEETVKAPGTLAVPAGARLQADKTYKVEITIEGRRLTAGFTPSASTGTTSLPDARDQKKNDEQRKKNNKDTNSEGTTSPNNNKKTSGSPDQTNPPPVADQSARGWRTWIWIATAAVLLLIAVGGAQWWYFRRYLPARELDPYWDAVRSVRARNWDAALNGLTSIESKLPDHLRNNARFFIGLCHFQLQNEVEAERMLAAMHRERPSDENVAYLLAYIRVARTLDAEAEPVLDALQKHGHDNFRDVRRLRGVVLFRRGMGALHSGEIDLAAARFAEVAKLGDFAAFIPGDLRNRHISLGTRALFERDLDSARQHFDALMKAASAMPEAEGKSLLAKASLGLALINWLQESPDRAMMVEKLLADTCLLFHADGPLELPWPAAEAGSAKGSAEELKRALEQADKNFDLPPDQKDVRHALRDLHLLRALAVLRHWSSMDRDAAKKALPETLERVLSRLACARALDERFADVYLVAGLLMFYAHPPGQPERINGADILAEARKLGARDPDALAIVNNREKIERENADAVDRYYQVLDHYLRDETVLVEVRRDLLNRLAIHRSLMNRFKPPDLSRARSMPPTVKELHDRSAVLQQKIAEIQFSKSDDRLKTGGERLRKQGDAFRQQAAALEEAEKDLLVLAGEQLFSD
jgi:TolA-binding protein